MQELQFLILKKTQKMARKYDTNLSFELESKIHSKVAYK